MNREDSKDCNGELNVRRKNATLKTKLINEEVYKNINWSKLEIEEKLAKRM